MDSKKKPSLLPSSRCPQCNTAVRASANFCGSCGASMDINDSLEITHDPLLNTLVGGRYKIREFIGKGALGSVYMAMHERIGKRVAVKFLHRELSQNSEFTRKFFGQARSSCRVNHPNAVSFNDFGATKDGTLYIIMEYAEGLDLTELVTEDHNLSLDVVLDIALQLCDVLNTAHEQGVTHGDLRPENVVLIPSQTDRFTVKLLDFGLSNLLLNSPETSQNTGVVFGAPEFTSPEQVEGEHPTSASDQYALGLILYFMLCNGAVPFGGEDRATTLYRQVHDAPTPPSSFTSIPDSLEDIILLALSKTPADRFPSIQHLADALEDVIIDLHDAGAFQTSNTGPELARRAAAKIQKRRRAAQTAREAAIQAAKDQAEEEAQRAQAEAEAKAKAKQAKPKTTTPPPAPKAPPTASPVSLEEPELRLRAPASLLDVDPSASSPDPGAIAISPNTLTFHPDDVPNPKHPPPKPPHPTLGSMKKTSVSPRSMDPTSASTLTPTNPNLESHAPSSCHPPKSSHPSLLPLSSSSPLESRSLAETTTTNPQTLSTPSPTQKPTTQQHPRTPQHKTTPPLESVRTPQRPPSKRNRSTHQRSTRSLLDRRAHPKRVGCRIDRRSAPKNVARNVVRNAARAVLQKRKNAQSPRRRKHAQSPPKRRPLRNRRHQAANRLQGHLRHSTESDVFDYVRTARTSPTALRDRLNQKHRTYAVFFALVCNMSDRIIQQSTV